MHIPIDIFNKESNSKYILLKTAGHWFESNPLQGSSAGLEPQLQRRDSCFRLVFIN